MGCNVRGGFSTRSFQKSNSFSQIRWSFTVIFKFYNKIMIEFFMKKHVIYQKSFKFQRNLWISRAANKTHLCLKVHGPLNSKDHYGTRMAFLLCFEPYFLSKFYIKSFKKLQISTKPLIFARGEQSTPMFEGVHSTKNPKDHHYSILIKNYFISFISLPVFNIQFRT